MLNDGLRDILTKQTIVQTKFAEQLLSEPKEVEHAYLAHYHTHVPLGDTDDFAKRLADKTKQAKTPKGAVVAPWGYGKTSTMIFTWKACEDRHLIAVPPFVCSSLQDILTATYGWLHFRLGRGDLAKELESVYNRYTHTAFEDHVKSVAKQVGVSEVDARAILDEERKQGTPVGELTPTNLRGFLEYAATLAKERAGFEGLVILADELQQLFDKTTNLRATIQQIREIVLWLATHNLPLGLVLCLPDSTESVVQDPGHDILDRLKSDRLYINLRDIYNVTFPTELWERYTEQFSLGDLADQVVHKFTLQAIGQIATRIDLGRGPRTVVDALQCAIRHYDKTGETYTPVDLIDDFINGQMSFDTGQISNVGQVHTIRSAVEDVLALANVVKTPKHRMAVKLWAAFPEHGCPDEVLDAFKVRKEADEISHVGHGELLTYQTSGYTLRKLASFTPGGEIVERIARDFWRAYRDEDPQWIEKAQKAFIDVVLPEIFEQKRWGRLDLRPTSIKGHGARLEGTFTDTYPKRLVDIQVGTHQDKVERRKTGTTSDLQFDFVLVREGDTPGRIELVGNDPRWIRFTLNIDNHALAGEQLPRDLTNLKASIHPKRLTPQLMLAFVGYCDGWEKLREGNRISPGEQGKVDNIKASMTNYAIRVLFSDDLRSTSPRRLQSPNVQMVRELFNATIKDSFPRYVSLWTAGEQGLKDYIGTLEHLSLKEKRGQKPLDERRKSQLAGLFGIGSWATFQARFKSGYAPLLQLTETRGDEAQVTLTLHPMETTTLNEFERSEKRRRTKGQELPVLSSRQFLDVANKEGYRDEEAGWVLKLLVARELVQVDKQSNALYRVPAGPAPDQVKKQLQDLYSTVHGLPLALVTEREKTPLINKVEALQERFSPDLDEEDLEELSLEVGRIEESLKDLFARKRHGLGSELDELVRKVDERQRDLTRSPELEEDIGPGLDFRRTLMDMQRELYKERGKLAKEIGQARQGTVDLQRQATVELGVMEVLQLHTEVEKAEKNLQGLDERCDALARHREGLRDWLKLLRDSDELYKSLETMPELRTKLTDDVVRRIMLNFAKRRFDALAEDAEQFRTECAELGRQRDTWVTAKREEFTARKDGLRNWLKTMGVERPDFPARYDHLEHDQSYEEMYDQVIKIARQHVEDIQKRLDELRLELRRAHQIQWAKLEPEEKETLKGLERDHTRLNKRRETAAQSLEKLSLVEADEKSLEGYPQAIKDILAEIKRIGENSKQFLRRVPPKTDGEKAVLELLREQREMDLTDLVLKTDIDLSEIMDGLIGLYQGNQVVIKVSRRG
jgi:hypothetical protein